MALRHVALAGTIPHGVRRALASLFVAAMLLANEHNYEWTGSRFFCNQQDVFAATGQ